MKSLLWKTGVIVSGLVFVLASTVFAEENKVNLGVSIPAATHGWTGGVVFWANQAKKDLEKAHPGLKITVKTAGSPAEQANQLQDLLTATKIDTLVVLPFESASLTKPVAQLKNKGVYVTVVDRGLTDPAAQDAYVSGDNPGFAKTSAEYLAGILNGKGNVVVLRGIPTTIDNERMEGFESVMKNYPEIKILDAKHGNWNRDDAFKVMQDYLTRLSTSTQSGRGMMTCPWEFSRPSSRPSATISRSSWAARDRRA
jgi:ribose transport system substrate-binding protein